RSFLGLQFPGDAVRLTHHAQHVPTGEVGQLVVAPAAARQLFEQSGILVDAVQAVGRRADAVEVAADTDAFDTGDLADVLDVIGDLGDGGMRTRVRLLPFVHGLFNSIRLADVLRVQTFGNAGTLRVPVVDRLRHERRVEVDHHDAVVLLDHAQDVVGHVAREIDQGAGARVREHHRRLAGLDGIAHGVGRYVAEVDQHPEPVHFMDHVATECGQT